jgi:hypothetical protein
MMAPDAQRPFRLKSAVVIEASMVTGSLSLLWSPLKVNFDKAPISGMASARAVTPVKG